MVGMRQEVLTLSESLSPAVEQLTIRQRSAGADAL